MLLEEAIKHCEEKAKCGDSCGTEHKQLAEWLRELMQLRYNRAKAEACGRNGLLTLEDLVRSGYDPNDVEQAVRERDGLIGRLEWRVLDLEKAVRLATDPKLRRVRGNLELAVKILNK